MRIMSAKNTFFIFQIQGLTSCIKRYESEIKSADTVTYAVPGHMNKFDEVQRANISTTSPVSKLKYFPVTGCTDKINTDQEVLGYFGAASVRSKRIIIKAVSDLTLYYYKDYATGILLKEGLEKEPEWMYPVYLYGNNSIFKPRMMPSGCVDYLSMAGTNVKHDFWL